MPSLLDLTLGDLVRHLETLLPGPAATHRADLFEPTPIREEYDMGEITVEEGGGALTAAVEYRDAHGHVTTPDATPSWTSSDEAVATVAAAEDGLSAAVSIVGPGSAIVEVVTVETADDGTETEIRATGLVNVTTGDAVVGDVSFTA